MPSDPATGISTRRQAALPTGYRLRACLSVRVETSAQTLLQKGRPFVLRRIIGQVPIAGQKRGSGKLTSYALPITFVRTQSRSSPD